MKALVYLKRKMQYVLVSAGAFVEAIVLLVAGRWGKTTFTLKIRHSNEYH